MFHGDRLKERTFKCRDCGTIAAAAHPTGRLPILCASCRGPTNSPEIRDRLNARRRSIAAGRNRQATSKQLTDAATLAVGLSLYSDPGTAAQAMGLDASLVDLDELERLARANCGDIIDGDLQGLARRLTAVINRYTIEAMQSLEEIAPRDRINAIRQIAAARDLLIGDSGASQFATVNIAVLGHDGQPIKLGGDDGG